MLSFKMLTGFVPIKEEVSSGTLSFQDLNFLVIQLLNVTAYLNSQGISLDQLDLSSVFVKGNLLKLSFFGVSLLPFKGKTSSNDL